ncbi:MAG: hypothetical protein DMF87_26380 [Acidobacteria bacterium]|nr:MAG: hypothetical protein DMF88_05560 [Acidobacteriota bacterium]PYR73200.1 MAG: hypothetical protein DMF87_26380 [Acidobacteriota bacterium]
MATENSGNVVLLIDRQIRTAIAHRHLIRFKYGSSVRIAEPHDYGIQHGLVHLLVYQRRAMPFSRGWRMLEVAKITELEVLGETFAGSRRAAHSHHFTWDTLFARVE